MGSFREKLTKENILMVVLAVSVMAIFLVLVYFVFPVEWRWWLTSDIGFLIVLGVCIVIFIIAYVIKELISR